MNKKEHKRLEIVEKEIIKKIFDRFKDEHAKINKLGKYAKKGTEDYFSRVVIDKWDRLLVKIAFQIIMEVATKMAGKTKSYPTKRKCLSCGKTLKHYGNKNN